MKEAIIYTYAWLTLAGALGGTVVYHVTNPEPQVYKPSMTRATTITGKGQFKCQAGC